jgi:GNAT superfamily N-acetyltransferase
MPELPQPEPAIRRAEPADAAVLAEIGRRTFVETFGHLYPPADLGAFLSDAHGLTQAQADLADPACAAWLAFQGDEVVGYVLAGHCALPHDEVVPPCGEIKRLYLLQRHQGGGLGGRLFDTAVAWLAREGPLDLWIGVWSQNHGAQRFYARRGFERVGEYGFKVGATVDQEFILRRDAGRFSSC